MDVSLLNNCSNDELYQFIHQMIDVLCNGKQPDINAYVPSIWHDIGQFKTACECCRQIILSASDVRSKSSLLNTLPENIQKTFYQCLEIRRIELKNAIIIRTITANNPILKDFDWKLKVVLASDKMVNMNEPLLDLELLIKNNIDEIKNDNDLIQLELNKEELNNLIASLENVQHSMKEQCFQ